MSRVPEMALGKMAICPSCRREFIIRIHVPTVQPVVIPVVHPPEHRPHQPIGLLVGLAISSFLVPLMWLLLKALGKAPPVFTLGLPLSIAIAATGLGIGVAWARDWSFSTRLKAILMLLGLAWGLAATFYFLKAEWVEAIRRDLGLPLGPWQEFKPPSKAYRVFMPGRPRHEPVEIVKGWTIDVHRFADREKQSYAFCVGDGKPTEAEVGHTDDQFFEAAKQGALAAAANGTLTGERPLSQQGQPGREYTFKLADQATNRTLRIYRVGTRAVVAMVEGAFLPPDAKEVRKFFDSLHLATGN